MTEKRVNANLNTWLRAPGTPGLSPFRDRAREPSPNLLGTVL